MSASASGSGSATASAGISFSTSAAEPQCDRACVDDPQCWQNRKARSAQNFLSVCRLGHGVFFLAYALLLIIIIIMVWLTSNGSISSIVNAWVDTFICVVVIILMALHAWLYVKGVIPECCASEGCTVFENAAAGNGGFSAAVYAQGGGNANGR